MIATCPAPIIDPLTRLGSLAQGLGLEAVAADAAAFAGRVAEGRFFVACIGQFKRGKSSLLNALIGDRVLPTGVVPVTSVVTVVRHGVERRARVRRVAGDWEDVAIEDLVEFVAEERNPGNRQHVAGVEVFVPHDLLAGGMCLVDTPGLGSVFTDSTAATHALLPHVDAALVVLGADPPISADELELVAQTAEQVEDLVFVLNKSDRLPDVQRAEARAFTERVLRERLRRPVGRLLEVSATEWLSGSGPARDSAEMHATLDTLTARSGATLVRSAEIRGLQVLAHRVLGELTERSDALSRPLNESAARVESLRRCAVDAERSLQDLHYQLIGEQERLARELTARRQGFLTRAIPEARSRLSDTFDRCRTLRGEALYQEAARLSQGIAREISARWRAEESPVAEERYRETSRRFVDAANAFLMRVTSAGGLDAAHAPQVIGEEAGFRVPGDFRHTELLPLTTPSPLARVVTFFLTRRQLSRIVGRRAGDYLERLVLTNVHRVTNALIEQALESRQRLESELRRQLREVVGRAQRAFDEARAHQARGAAAVRAEIERLQAISLEVAALSSAAHAP